MFELQPGLYRRLIARLWKLTLAGVLLLVLYIVAVSFNFLWLFGGMPSLKALENPESYEASEIYSEDGVLISKYYLENRTPVEISQVSPNVISALLATEDARFMKHSGIDARSIFRAVNGVLTGRSSSGGGSTLTQQVAKNLFETRTEKFRGVLGKIPYVRVLIDKTKEWILAVRLERNYTKQEILMMYLNTVSFGNNTFGIKTAAKTYFNKEPWQLNVEEAALLVGMLQNPSRFNPRLYEERSQVRRNVVLFQMRKYGFLNDGQFNTYKQKPIKLDFNIENQNTGRAAYFRSVIREDIQKWLDDYNEAHPEEELDLYTSGLKIRTTIDSRLQKYAEEAVYEHMREQQRKFYEHWRGRNPWVFKAKDGKFREIPGFIEQAAKRTPRYIALKREYGDDEKAIWAEMRKPVKMKVFVYGGRRNEKDTVMSPLDSIKYYKRFLNVGFMSMDPRNGHVKAWVGGINFKYFKFDHVKQAKRQPGSTFKPFVYLTAIDKNFLTPCDRVTDQPVRFEPYEDNNGPRAWVPHNSNNKWSYQPLSLRQALGRSINSVSAQLIKQAKSASVVEYAHKLGVESDLTANPTLCLGTSDVSVYEMVAAYCTFANAGYRVKPLTVLEIRDKNGNLLTSFFAENKLVINANTAYQMLYLMRGAVEDADGTSQRLRTQYKLLEGGNEIAAKTGTTSSYSDGWFMGMTQNLVSGLWVGGDERSIHFRDMALGQGARVAMPAWGMYMQKAYADPSLKRSYPRVPFRKPDGFNLSLDCGGYAIDSTQRYIPPKVVESEEEEILN